MRCPSFMVMGLGLLALTVRGGCAHQGKCTLISFSEPRVNLWAYEDPVTVGPSLRPDGVTIEAGKGVGGATGSFLIKGTGWLYWGALPIKVNPDGIDVNGVAVESAKDRPRNAFLDLQNGKVEKDTCIPWE